jgi:primary-amine oxidase
VASNNKSKDIAIDGNTVRWQNWSFRYGFNVREGLVLYQVGINDAGKTRSMLYRASSPKSPLLTEMLTPSFRGWNISRGGEFGLGYLSAEVKPGREIPSNALVLSPVMPDSTKSHFSTRLRNRIYLYQRDAGNLLYYRQREYVFHARSTELVIGFVSSIGNYVYAFNWVFKQDGSFDCEIELAGEILTKVAATQQCEICTILSKGPGPDGEKRTYRLATDERYGARVHPSLVGIHHQHWFNLRLDFDLDDVNNAVMENNMERPVEGSRSHGEYIHSFSGNAGRGKAGVHVPSFLGNTLPRRGIVRRREISLPIGQFRLFE